jgi:hypothetical protein
MAHDAQEAAPAGVRAARDLIDAVVDNMLANREPLKYSAVVPGHYTVYVHPEEFARVEGILPLLADQSRRALTEALAALNRRWSLGALTRSLSGEPAVPTERLGDEWHVAFLPDPDAELTRGEILVDPQLGLPAGEAGAGHRTRRVVTARQEGRATTPEPGGAVPTRRSTVSARLEYHDDSGPHVVELAHPSTTVGRGGSARPVDVRVEASADVSREHARFRLDGASGCHYLTDLSTLGTTVDGRPVAPGYDERDGHRRENGVETLLHDGARIGLADTVFLTFRTAKS